MAHEYPFSDLSELNYSKERRVRNEQLFFDMNNRIKESAKALLRESKTGYDELELRMACECSDASCLKKITISIATFDRIHRAEGQYMLLPGHDQRDIEEIVAEHPDYIIVRKFAQEA